MKKPGLDGRHRDKAGLDGRHRDKDGEIQRKRSDTLNKNLSKPIPQFSPDATLGKMREKTGKISEADVRRAAVKLVGRGAAGPEKQAAPLVHDNPAREMNEILTRVAG